MTAPLARKLPIKKVPHFLHGLWRKWGLLRYKLLICFVHAINGFVVRIAFIFQLLNQAAARKSHIVKVSLRGFCGLLVPIGAAVVGGVDRFGMGIVFIFQLLNEPGVGKRRVIEVFTGAC